MSEQIRTDFLSCTDSGAVYGKPGLDLLLVQTPLCRAVIARQGAQLLEFQAADREPLLWLSPEAQFEAGKAVRGGIPLCLPWFGIHRRDPAKPKHGLVRTQAWQLAGAKELEHGDVELVFTFRHAGSELFAAPFFCEFRMRLGRELQLHLRLENLSEETAEYSWAWHTYFPVASVREIEVHGLEHTDYLDNTRELARFRQEGPLTFPGEVDRVFENAPAHQRILTSAPIDCYSDNCRTVITWNPGAELAATLADVGEHYGEFVCVEHGNAFAGSWQLAPAAQAEAALILQR
ncbi:D-hexose-6-phosphate mutarotase [Microbulbifer magnicolonia]|uniref:D-hexose-6-phosphate mutarotase n=1 Tax=Microbulbifer magnicolonia TaxID=3109744 RepID=UPI002B405BC3|nr:D-hexose-6-phosphate mutarotase [Microbulbifer sp. GG15]